MNNIQKITCFWATQKIKDTDFNIRQVESYLYTHMQVQIQSQVQSKACLFSIRTHIQ